MPTRYRSWLTSTQKALLLVLLLSSTNVAVHSFAQRNYLSHKSRSSSTSAVFAESTTSQIRFLGKGPNAIVRPGTVLLAPKNEFHHFYRQAAIFIYAMGEDEENLEDTTYMIRGAILDHPTPFTLGEMAASTVMGSIQGNPMASNLIYRGGDKGGDNVFMLHNQEAIGDGDMIGTSGIFQGGLQEALDACSSGKAKAEDFKFFFNFCQFSEEELESMLDDDPWIAVEVPSKYVLSAEWDRGDCWRQLRNALKQEIEDVDEE